MKSIEPKNEFSENYFFSAIQEILDIDQFILKTCNFDNTELSNLFNKAVTYHNSLAELNEKLQNMETSISQSWPGEYSRDVKTIGYTANALKITQQMNHIENRLSRLADSIMLRAKISHSHKNTF